VERCENHQYLVNITYRPDGQLEFTPNILQNVPAGAIITFVPPTNTPFYLYKAPYNPSQNLCASYTRMNGLTTSAGSQIYVVASDTEVMAHFACPVITSTCTCDGNSLFLLNPKSSITRSNVQTVTISATHEVASPKTTSVKSMQADSQPSNVCY
jgi:hypothetical protein